MTHVEKLLIQIPGISPLQYEDEQYLRSSFSERTIEYAQSFLYLLRASHSEKGTLGYKFIKSGLVAIIGYRKNSIYITPITDISRGVKLEKLCNTIHQRTGCNIIIKKFSKKRFININISREYLSENELEDDTCPETIINLRKLFITQEGKVNPKAKRFFRKVKRFKKLNIQLDILEDISYITQKDIELFLKIDHNKFISYYPMLPYLFEHQYDDRYSIIIFLHKNIIQAVYFIERFSPTQVGLYCGITAKNRPGITEWMDYHVFQKMFFEGVKTVYLGGSENKGINYFVKKLLPDKPEYSNEAVQYLPCD